MRVPLLEIKNYFLPKAPAEHSPFPPAASGPCKKGSVMVVDDNRFSRMTAVDILSADDYEVIEADSSSSALADAKEQNLDLILLDVMMPQLNGWELCQQLKENDVTHTIPIVFMTVSEERQVYRRCLEVGGADCLRKPLDRLSLLSRTHSLIEQKRLQEDLAIAEQGLLSIAQAVKNRYPERDRACAKLVALSQEFGAFLHLSWGEIESLKYAARLHDLGTVGIPDAILLKQGELTPEELELVKEHTLIGERLCQPLRHRRQVLPILRHHHERWDGSGYPDQLAQEQIPFLAQVFQILDIYSALTSDRPYQPALSCEEAMAVLVEETEKGWRNPQLSAQFVDYIHSGAETLLFPVKE
ncbi:MAG: response regulator [Chloroflexaceae bacterium]|nr:response regulator [Chloroflexaceae bacterium]